MKPGLLPLIAGTILILIALIVPIASIAPKVMEDNVNEPFLVPGDIEVHVEKPGRYYLWNDFRTIHDNRTYNTSETLPDGLEISITDADGASFDFHPRTNTTVTVMDTAKRSVGYIEITAPATVRVSVQGDTPERVFSFAESRMSEIMHRVLVSLGATAIFGVAGIILVINGIVKFGRKNPLTPTPPPPFSESPQSPPGS